MKRKLRISAFVVVVLLVCGALYIALPLCTIYQLNTRYQQVQRGMTVEQVEALMAHRGGRASPHWVPMWDGQQLSPAEAQRISSALRYSVDTFYLPVSFEFTFDSQRRLIGRHIYD